MRSENLEKFIKNVRLDIETNVNRKVFSNIIKAFEKSKAREKSLNKLNTWSIIMKSNITKLAVAALIIIAVLLILNNSSVDITSNVYAEITENMQEMPWVHIIMIIEYPAIDERIAEVDVWYSNNEEIIGMKDSIRGNYSYSQNEKKYDYNPDTNSITVSYINEADYSNNLINLKAGFDSWLKQYGQQGTEINHYLGEFEGEKVEIYETQEERGGGKIYVSPVSRLPIYAEFTDTYQGNQGNVQFYFEFPESGPRNIYDLGVPRDVPIIEK